MICREKAFLLSVYVQCVFVVLTLITITYNNKKKKQDTEKNKVYFARLGGNKIQFEQLIESLRGDELIVFYLISRPILFIISFSHHCMPYATDQLIEFVLV